jgi:hypothetical protein
MLMQKFHPAILQKQRFPEKERYPLPIYADESHEHYIPDTIFAYPRWRAKVEHWPDDVFSVLEPVFPCFGTGRYTER